MAVGLIKNASNEIFMYSYLTHDPVFVAQKMLQIAAQKGIALSNLQLQKLVYIAHGYLLGWRGRPLINQPIEAWTYGPVVSSIYNSFKSWGDQKIPPPPPHVSYPIDSDTDAISVLDGVLDLYGRQGAMELVNLTHQSGTPWDWAWTHGGGQSYYSVPIPDDLIKEHFEKAIANPDGVIGL